MDPVSLALHGGLDGVLQCQQQIIRRDQALAAGIAESTIDSLISRKRWKKILPRVYSVGADVLNPSVKMRAGWLWAGHDAVMTGVGAAWWLGLVEVPPDVFSIAVPPSRRLSAQQGYEVVRTRVHNTDTVERDRIVITSPARTCLDLARQNEADRLEIALRRRLVTPNDLQVSLDLGKGTRGQKLARQAQKDTADNPWSYPERAAHRLFRSAGLTGWTGNGPVRLPGGTVFPDIRFDRLKLIVEIDGRRHHSSPAAFDSDHDRQNRLVSNGWTVLRVTPRQLAENPAQVIGVVRQTMARLEAAYNVD